MSAFLTLAALLLLLALAFVLPPLLWQGADGEGPARSGQLNLAVLRDQLRELDADLASGAIAADAYPGARLELERRVAEDVGAPAPSASARAGSRWQAGTLGLAVVLGAGVLYAALGTPHGLAPASTAKPMLNPQQAEAMVARLARHMQAEPGNAEGWLLLARSYTALKRYADAGAAYARLLALVPDDPQALTGYADVLSVAQGRTLQGEPERLLRRALAVEPNNAKALILLGSAEFERGDFVAAIASWEKVSGLVEPESETGRLAANNIADARTGLAAARALGANAAAPAGVAAGVEGIVELDPALLARVDGGDTVFIFARAADGPRFPLDMHAASRQVGAIGHDDVAAAARPAAQVAPRRRVGTDRRAQLDEVVADRQHRVLDAPARHDRVAVGDRQAEQALQGRQPRFERRRHQAQMAKPRRVGAGHRATGTSPVRACRSGCSAPRRDRPRCAACAPSRTSRRAGSPATRRRRRAPGSPSRSPGRPSAARRP